MGGCLFATYVTSSVASASIKSIDPSKALAIKGVVTFISAAAVKADGYCNLVRYYIEFLIAEFQVKVSECFIALLVL